MFRILIIALSLALSLEAVALVEVAHAQAWATKMFKTTNHDYGTVARGAKSEFSFELTNQFEEDVHIAGVRTSCGCVTPRVGPKSTLKTWEKGEIICAFNTGSFEGQRNATVTVTIDKPFFAEVQLNVSGFIRRDVVLTPGEVDFGSVDQGGTLERKFLLTYAGRSTWQIVDVRSNFTHVEVEKKEIARGPSNVQYDLTVRLKPDAPVGYIEDQLILISDDPGSKNMAVSMTGQIVPAVSVSPALVDLGEVAPGTKVTKQLIVRSKKPFAITSVKCPDGCFSFKPTEGEKKLLHIVPFTFTASDKPGKIVQKIEIETDLGKGFDGSCVASATVKAATSGGE